MGLGRNQGWGRRFKNPGAGGAEQMARWDWRLGTRLRLLTTPADCQVSIAPSVESVGEAVFEGDFPSRADAVVETPDRGHFPARTAQVDVGRSNAWVGGVAPDGKLSRSRVIPGEGLNLSSAAVVPEGVSSPVTRSPRAGRQSVCGQGSLGRCSLWSTSL